MLSVPGNLSCIVANLLHPLLPDISPKDTIIVGGSFRSGTTWIAETIASLPGFLMIFEPLSECATVRVRKLRLDFPQSVPEKDVFPELKAILSDAVSGRSVTCWMTRGQRWRRLFSRRRIVVKFIDCGLYMGWLQRTFPGNRPLYLIRDPVAVVESMLKTGWMDSVQTFPRARTSANALVYKKHQSVLGALRGPEEVIAARWALENAAVINNACVRSGVTLLDYQRLCASRVKMIEVLSKGYGLDMTHVDPHFLAEPSSSTRGTRGDGSMLSSSKAKRMREIACQLGANFYSEDGRFLLRDDLDQHTDAVPLKGKGSGDRTRETAPS